MTALSNARMVAGATVLETLDAKLAADAVIYKGALCGFKAGYLVKWVDSDTDIKHPCIAIPEIENVIDNTGGSAGDLSCPVKFIRPKYLYRFANDSAPNAIAQANIGGDAWGKDDQTVSASSASSARSRVGTPWLVITTNARGYPQGVYVELESPGPDYTILDSLAATTNGNGASMVGIEDAGTFTTAANVEAALAEIYQHLKSTQASILLSLMQFREVTSGGDVANAAGIGGVLASDTTPIMRADAAESHEISWAAGNADIISAQIAIPADFDGTADASLDLWVYTDNSGGGGIDAATFTVETSWNGGALVSDTATDGTPAITHHKITATIAAADVPDAPSYVTIHLTPAAHANDPVQLVAARMNYKRKLLTS